MAAEQAEFERVRQERIERQRLLKEENERLAADQAELERLELERIESERLLAEQQQQQQKEEADRLNKQRLENERLDRDQLMAEQQQRTAEEVAKMAAIEADLVKEVQSQKIIFEKVNIEAKESANQLVQVQQERDELQSSNEELGTMCEQLKADLHRAAESISQLKVSISEQEEKERIRWEQEARRLEEEESSIIITAKQDMDSQIVQVRESYQSQLDLLEKELVEERKLSVDQQHDLQQRLEEATARISMSESEIKGQASKKEAKTARQLQQSEKAAAKAVALLDKKEGEVKQLQQVIADSKFYILTYL